MSTTFSVLPGDTFESIARRAYGTDKEASRISRANPGATEPLSAGALLIAPRLPGGPLDLRPQAQFDSDDEVAVLIRGRRFRFWESIKISRSIDAMDTLELTAPFEPSALGFRESFRPLAFDPVDITVGGSPLFTGTMVGVTPVIGNDKKTISVNGYSLPGVLNDCTPPASSFPLEFNDQSLRDIAAVIAGDFGLSVEFRAEQGPVFERVACSPGKKALIFLTELARQRNLIISSTSQGALVFWDTSSPGAPVVRLEQGVSPVLSVSPFFSPQEYYSHITGMQPVIVGLEGSQFTVKNDRLSGVVRPLTFSAPDTLDSNIKAAVEAKSGRMFGNAVSYSVTVSTWRDARGNLWDPNTTVKLQAPGAMIYEDYEFTLRRVDFIRTPEGATAVLELVLPGAFNGRIPRSLPWEG